MKKSLFKYMGCMMAMDDVPRRVPDPEFQFSQTDVDRILNDIFSVDERTGLPKGDIAYYLSPDGNPAVKDWLVNNLLQPRVVGSSSIKDVSDDTIEEFARRADETIFDYRERIYNIGVAAREEAERLANEPKTD